MKKTNKLFFSVICILLSVLIASATLMAGATDTAVSEDATVSEKPTLTGPVINTVVTTTQKDIDKVVEDFIYDNGLDEDLSQFGDDIREFSGNTSGILSGLIEAFEEIRNAIVNLLNQIFKFDFLK